MVHDSDRAVLYDISAFDAYLRASKAEATAEKYVASARLFLQFCERQGLTLEQMPQNVMDQFVIWLVANKKHSPRSIQLYTIGARTYLRWCRGQGLVHNGDLHADTPRALARTPDSLNDANILQFLRLASEIHEPFRSALMLLPFCGLRSEELATLKLDNMRRIALPVTGASEHREHLVFVVRGKGGTARIAPLLMDGPPLLMEYMKGWRRHVDGGEWIFPNAGGLAPISTRTLRHHCQLLSSRLSQPSRLSPHKLRRTYATALWRQGIDIPTLARVMGHKSVQTTYDHYLDMQPEDVVNHVHKVGARLVLEAPHQEKNAQLLSFLKQRPVGQ